MENELFARAVQQDALPNPAARAQKPLSAAQAALQEKRRALAEDFNAEAIDAFGQGRYQAATPVSSEW